MTVEKRFKRDLTAADLAPLAGHFQTEGGCHLTWDFLEVFIRQGLIDAHSAGKAIKATGGVEFKRLALDYVVPLILQRYPAAKVYCSVYLVNTRHGWNTSFIASQVSNYFSVAGVVKSDDWDVFPLDGEGGFDPMLPRSVGKTYGKIKMDKWRDRQARADAKKKAAAAEAERQAAAAEEFEPEQEERFENLLIGEGDAPVSDEDRAATREALLSKATEEYRVAQSEFDTAVDMLAEAVLAREEAGQRLASLRALIAESAAAESAESAE